MEQSMQPQQPNAPAPVPEAKNSNKTILWVIGGCLIVIIVGFLITAGLVWFGVRKVKRELKENQPKLEQWGKDVQKMQEQAEKAQREKQNLVPVSSNSAGVGAL